jgi:KEOPS complex subunit Cgi121
MILETVDMREIVLQGLSNCRSGESGAVLRKMRSDFPESHIQLVRADRVAGKEHLVFAAEQAVRSFRQHRQRARTLAVELLLCTSCQRQISKAIQLLGVGPGTHDVVLAAFANKAQQHKLVREAMRLLHASPDDRVIEISSKKMRELMKAYSISQIEMEASRLPSEEDTSVLKRLVIERSALLAVEK